MSEASDPYASMGLGELVDLVLAAEARGDGATVAAIGADMMLRNQAEQVAFAVELKRQRDMRAETPPAPPP